MASSCGLLFEELQCSICLDVFTDPVTTPCGHNFCKICLKDCWDSSLQCFCPVCIEKFPLRPNLKINITFREVVEQFKRRKNPAKPGEVQCDACTNIKQKAQKSCLDCGVTYCETHLEPHYTVAKLKKHKLIKPVDNLEDYMCQKHKRPLEWFCLHDRICVCLFCSLTDHKPHNTVPIEESSEARKAQVEKKLTEVHQMIQDRKKKIQEIEQSVQLRKENADKEKTYCSTVLTGLICSIERCEAELLDVMELKQKAAEMQAKALIKELEKEITELKRRDTELEQLSHTEDHLHLLQYYRSLFNPLNTKNWTKININTHVNMDTLMRALIHLKETMDEKLSETVLKRLQHYAVDVSFDPDTAHPTLILSEDRKQAKQGRIKVTKKLNVPENRKRFTNYIIVLGKEGFSSGRFYYEVQIEKKTNWVLGVARESIYRKQKMTLSPEDGNWTVGLMNGNEYQACESPSVSLSLKVKPQKVGVFVDYEGGLVCFYDVESLYHIYSFTGQCFTEKLYPFFSPCSNANGKNATPLVILPIKNPV
ncbi:E3 ubiquitin-protein ligase TRIM39-like isoform X1 [Xyrauchen texanus]|uniref:E3 ubiquitin-protein ligase TRIM39-like isoform X1 n=1 Tax=Xyrauchen texanus TaxID=154827 RepID=UPI0022428394|nr:E3 ubiquitin-protein ligase TRIM39-like isoform X1 [Xyrauchen texanus]